MSNEARIQQENLDEEGCMWTVALCAALVLLSLSIQGMFVAKEIQKDSWHAAIAMTLLGPAMFGLAVAALVNVLRREGE